MKLVLFATGYLISSVRAQNWKLQEGKEFWGDCGVLPNFQNLQEANYNVQYKYDERVDTAIAKVWPALCQSEKDKDSDRYMKQQKNKEERAEKKKQREQEKKERKRNNEEKRNKNKKKQEENKQAREDAKEAKKHGGMSSESFIPDEDLGFDQTNELGLIIDGIDGNDEMFNTPLDVDALSDTSKKRRRRSLKILSRKRRGQGMNGSFDQLRMKKSGSYQCDDGVWTERRTIQQICEDDEAPANEEYQEEANGIHIEGDEECPRNHVWDDKKEEFVMNPCSSLGDINAWPTVDKNGNRGCLNARSLIHAKEGKSNYRFRAENAKIKQIPCGASIKYLLELEADDYDEYHYVNIINLRHNQLSHIPCSLFWRVATAELYLSHNKLTKICPNMLDLMNRAGNMQSLHSIYLGFNNLPSEALKADFFKYTNITEILKLDDNKFTYLEKQWFDDTPKAKAINLANNKLEDDGLPEKLFELNTEVQFLLLANNKLTMLPDDITTNMKNLRTVWFNDNHLASIPDTIFDNNKRLVHIYLGDNRFTSVSTNLFQNKIFLRGTVMESDRNRCTVEGCYLGELHNPNTCSCVSNSGKH